MELKWKQIVPDLFGEIHPIDAFLFLIVGAVGIGIVSSLPFYIGFVL